MNDNFNILRVCCLIQDRDSQDLKRIILSIIFEILYENDNSEIQSDLLFQLTNDKFNTKLDKDLFDNILVKSQSFELITTGSDPLVRLTSEKYSEIDKNIAEYSIDSHIEKYLHYNKLPSDKKDKIIEILFQSIYENIYTFTPNNIKTIIPQNVSTKLSQQDLDIFNSFLEYDDSAKNRCLYNQFAKAIEFAILTSGKGALKFSEGLYKNKSYLLDTNIIFRLIGVGGPERQNSLVQLLKDCLTQGITFEYSHHTLLELNKKLEQCVIEITRIEKSRKVEIMADLFDRNPHFFNDDFVTQYCKLRNEKKVNSPEQYEIEMKSRFKSICKDLQIQQTDNSIQIIDKDKIIYSELLIKKRKELNVYFRYSTNQAKVDAYNILYVRKLRGSNNYSYSDVKSFYLTTDRGLNKILSNDNDKLITETILPSQLFIIHNPLTNLGGKEPDFKTFFRFLKRRTSEFKLRGKDVVNYITQARLHTEDPKAISSLVEAYSDQRYKYSKIDALNEGEIINFRKFTETYFDKKLSEMQFVLDKHNQIQGRTSDQLTRSIIISNKCVRYLDFILTFILIPSVSIFIKFITNLSLNNIVFILIVCEVSKFIISTRTNFLKNIWKNLYVVLSKRTPYFKLTFDQEFIEKGISIIDQSSDNIWKKIHLTI
jgi:hypothetical protein